MVDVREFMSHLPAVLHQQGMELIPVTLEVLPPYYSRTKQLAASRKHQCAIRHHMCSCMRA